MTSSTQRRRVFFARGFDGATMDDVAREADFSKRTLYKYFSSKNQLTLAIAHRGFCHSQRNAAGDRKQAWRVGLRPTDWRHLVEHTSSFETVISTIFEPS